MEAGKLRYRVALQRQISSATDSYGQRSESWETVAYRWAAIRAVSGSEYQFGKQRQADVTHEIRLRCLGIESLSPTWRIVYGSSTYQLIDVLDPDLTGQYFLCHAKLVVT